MHQSNWAESALDYRICRYGSSRMLYRGPKKRLNRDYVAFLGGSETYGRFVASPFPEMLDDELAEICVNLGCNNGGIDAILQDESLLSICNQAKITVVQILGAANLSNRFYTVHPRRNDRFIQASPLMERLFPELDFMEFNFTMHLLAKAKSKHPEPYKLLVKSLQETWVLRMRQLVERLNGRVVLLWMEERDPPDAAMESKPLFVTKRMIDLVKSKVIGAVTVCFSEEAKALGTEGMYYLDHEGEAAGRLPGPLAHYEVAKVLAPVLQHNMHSNA